MRPSHEQVKRIFLAALERMPEERASWLNRECSGDEALRREVEYLLAHHHDATVIGVGVSGPDTSPSSSFLKRLTPLLELLRFVQETPLRRFVALFLVVAAVAALALWARARAIDLVRTQVPSILETEIVSTGGLLELQVKVWKAEVDALAKSPAVIDATRALIAAPDQAAWKRLVAAVEPQDPSQSRVPFLLMDASGAMLATSEGLDRALRASSFGMAALAEVNRGVTVARFIGRNRSAIGLPAEGMLVPLVTIYAPVHQPDGRILGALALIKQVSREYQFLARLRALKSFETYLFAEDGLMLSPSRFEADLVRWKVAQVSGLAGTQPVLYLRDPGRNLYESNGPKPGEDPNVWPLTELVRQAVAHHAPGRHNAVLPNAYRGYRGAPVFGGWHWDDALNIYIGCEVDEQEALAIVRPVGWAIGLVSLLLIGSGAWVVFSSVLVTHLRRRAMLGEALGQYTLLEKIGEGGMGEVYIARHALLRRPAAVKLLRRDRLSPAFLEQFEREAQASSLLRHPSTVQIYDYGKTSDGTPYFVMEYIVGLDLGQWVRRYGPMSPARAVHIARQIAGALHEAHLQHVIHRDIKPANVMLCSLPGEYDLVKLLDFGLAKDIRQRPGETSPLFRAGTPHYTAPERLRPDGTPVDQFFDNIHVWVREGGTWKVLASMSRLQTPP